MSHQENMTTMENRLNHHQEKLSAAWLVSQDNAFIKSLQQGLPMADILKKAPAFARAFKSEGEILEILACSDGRVSVSENGLGNEKLGLAGEGILLPENQLADFISDKKGKITVVTSHAECGAAALKFKELLDKGEALPEGVTTSDELGIHFAKNLAEKLGAAYYHIGKEKLVCEVHNERLLIIDGTARFSADKIIDFPAHFSSAALGLGENADYVKNEAEILSSIALGDHGFGERFTVENPFYLIIIAQDQAQLEQVQNLFLPFVEKAAGRINIQGVLAPPEKE